MTIALWLLLTIGYDHAVRATTWPSEAACAQERRALPFEVRDSVCLRAA
jgi:hypothetical protein